MNSILTEELERFIIMKQLQNVFFIDDDGTDTFLNIHVFKKLDIDFKYRVFVDIRSAIQHMEDNKNDVPDIIFLDLFIPGENGFNFLDWIRKNNETNDIPVIVLSGSDNEADKKLCFKKGATQFIQKPLQEANLENTLRDLKLSYQTST